MATASYARGHPRAGGRFTRDVMRLLAVLLLAGCTRTIAPPPPPPPAPSPPPPAPSPPPAAPESAQMDDVTGWRADDAVTQLRRRGFEVEVMLYTSAPADAPRAAPGRVFRQSPKAGTRLRFGEAVTLHVLADELEAMPPPPPPSPLPPAPGPPPAFPPPDPPPASQIDTDGDGVLDRDDLCPLTPGGSRLVARGCSEEQGDQLEAALPDGTYAFNAQDTMAVDHDYVVVLVLTPALAGDTAATNVQARATVLVELARLRADTQDSVRVEVRRTKFSNRMRAQLQGPESWMVRPRAGYPEERLVSGSDSTVWVWDVTPRGCSTGVFRPTLGCGEETLTLAVNALFGEYAIPWPLINESIHVRLTPGQKVAGVARAGLPFAGLLLLPALVVWWTRRRRRVTILFLAANPHDTDRLNLDEEIRAIDAALQKAPHRDRFRIEQHWAVRSTELDDFLLRHRPQIVHFSGHGSAENELILERGSRTRDLDPVATVQTSAAVPAEALSRVFAPLKGTVRCVVLNACYSEGQARAIAQHVDCVVGMSNAIADAAAIHFAEAFYQALAHGESIRHAFDLATSEIERGAITGDDVPQLIGASAGELVFAGRGSGRLPWRRRSG